MSETAHPALQHHFEDLDQQREASSLGMWLFLVTEVMFFGGLIATYVVYRSLYPEAWKLGSLELDIGLGAVNTAVLIASSLTMALAVWAAQKGRRKQIILFLLLTMTLGLTFLGVKVIEYTDKWSHNLVPGSHFAYDGAMAPHVELFFGLYFCMTGLHALHMIVGVGILTYLLFPAWKNRFNQEYHNPVEVSGLYWHFVDIVWIFLFPLLYLLGRH